MGVLATHLVSVCRALEPLDRLVVGKGRPVPIDTLLCNRYLSLRLCAEHHYQAIEMRYIYAQNDLHAQTWSYSSAWLERGANNAKVAGSRPAGTIRSCSFFCFLVPHAMGFLVPHSTLNRPGYLSSMLQYPTFSSAVCKPQALIMHCAHSHLTNFRRLDRMYVQFLQEAVSVTSPCSAVQENRFF